MTPITVMTWNVRYFGHALRGLLATERGMRRAAHALAMLVPLPDLIALQEVETTSLRAGMNPVPQLDRFLDLLHEHLAAAGRSERFEGLYYPAHAYQIGKAPAVYTTGLAMLVGPRLHIEAHNVQAPHDITHVRLRAFKPLKQKRIVAHARVRPVDGGPSLDVFNTHMSLPAFLEVGPTRVARRMGDGSNQVREVQTLLDFVRDRAGDAAVIVGDFNTRPGSPAYQAVIDAGFHDAYAAAHGLEIEHAHAHPTAGFAHLRMHIDHVFASPGMDWEAFDHLPFGASHAFHGISDHSPKIGRLLLPMRS